MELLFILLWIFVNLKEDFLQSRHRDAVAQDIHFVHIVVKVLEELLELSCLLITYLEGDFLRHFR